MNELAQQTTPPGTVGEWIGAMRRSIDGAWDSFLAMPLPDGPLLIDPGASLKYFVLFVVGGTAVGLGVHLVAIQARRAGGAVVARLRAWAAGKADRSSR